MVNVTHEEVKQFFNYDELSGNLIWKITKGNSVKGTIAGTPTHDGIQVGINKKTYRIHRIIWLWKKGYFPENGIDHEDRNPYNNAWNNLREVTQSCNTRNTGNFSTNTSGVKGVRWVKDRNKWCAYIYLNNKCRFLGEHKEFDEAVFHRLAAEQCLNWEGCDSNSPAYMYAHAIKSGIENIGDYVHGRE